MTKDEKVEAIQSFEELSNAFDDVLDLPESVILYRPFDDAWSIVEQIVHCLDFDMANFHRYRWAIVSPGAKVLSFDSAWTNKLNYQSSDIKLTIDLIKLIRIFMASHLRTIIDDNWKEYKYILGDKNFNLEDAIKLYIEHVDFHRKLIDRNIEMYNNR